MHKPDKVQWGIIGCGAVTEVKSGPAFNLVDNSELVAVMRRNVDLAKDYAVRHKVPKWYSDANELINDPEINAVYIATPPDSHAEYAIKVAEAGKHVYVEKPMALNPHQCELMIKACKDSNVHLFVAYYRRALPKFLKIKELLKQGEIGEVAFVNIRLYLPPEKEDFEKNNLPWRVLKEISGGGYFMDMASHQIDLLHFLFGNIKNARGTKKNVMGLYPAEDYVHAEFEFGNNLTGSGTWFFGAREKAKIDEVEIIGTKGGIVFSTFDESPIQLFTEKGKELLESKFPLNIQYPLIERIVKTVLEDSDNPCSGDEGLKSNIILDIILKSHSI